MTKLLSDAEISKEVADAVLPLFMRAGDRFGLSAEGKLDASGMHNWERRCDEWLTGYHAMRRAGADENATAIRLDGIDGSSSLMQCAQRCTQLRDVALRDGYLSDHALTSLAMVMKARLRALDLHGTQGFGDHGLKALAAHATDLESLRLGGCHASDASLVAIAKYCPKLRTMFMQEMIGRGVLFQGIFVPCCAHIVAVHSTPCLPARTPLGQRMILQI